MSENRSSNPKEGEVMSAEYFLWSAFFAVVGFAFFAMLKKNVVIRLLFLVLALGGTYAGLLFWKFMDVKIAFAITLLVFLISGIILIKDRKAAQPNLGIGLVITIVSLIVFLVVMGALSATSGFFAQVGDILNAAGDFFRQLFGMTKQGVEEINR